MARYIDAERLKRTFASGIRVYDGMCKVDDVMHNIDNEPTADVQEVKHGEWLVEAMTQTPLSHAYIRKQIFYICPYCNKEYRQKMNYCGNCGAKMDGGKAE